MDSVAFAAPRSDAGTPGGIRWDAGADARGVHQMAGCVISDQERIEHVSVRKVAADHKLLSPVRSRFDPIRTSLARAILAAGALGNDSLERRGDITRKYPGPFPGIAKLVSSAAFEDLNLSHPYDDVGRFRDWFESGS
jgi:hypothetical protein